MNKIHKNIIVSGFVQGVGFRFACVKSARRYGINGFVKNLSNGNVYIEAEGNNLQLTQFIKWCHEGSPHSKVFELNIQDGKVCNYECFELKH